MNTSTNQNAVATSMTDSDKLSGPTCTITLPMVWEEEMLGQGAGIQSIDLTNWDDEKRADFIRFFVGYGLRAATKSATAGKSDKRKAREDRLATIVKGEYRTRQAGEKAEGLPKSVVAGLKAWLMAEFSRRVGKDLKLTATTDPEKMLESFSVQLLDAMVGENKWTLAHKEGTANKFRPAFEAEMETLKTQAESGAQQLPAAKSADDFLNSL